ncbi:hypothetical protein EON81_14390 [bacterium]|nr:MAG: hypothetical protein EON81_14390 [bacterium]
MQTIESLARLWDVSLQRRLPGSTCSEVWAGTREGEAVVVKLPRADAEEAKSLPTLRSFSRWGGVEVLASDEETGACLLPRLGHTIDESDLGDDENTRIFAHVALALRQSEKVEAPSFEQFAADAFSSNDEVLSEPLRLISRQVETAKELTLIHGDLHHFNLLWGDGCYVAIDPKGILTDLASEVVAWARNPRPERVTPEKTRRRLEIIADVWGESYGRLWSWAWAGNVISLWWEDPKGSFALADIIRDAK